MGQIVWLLFRDMNGFRMEGTAAQCSRSRSEVVATFIAILDLLKSGSAVLEDDDTSGEDPNVKLIKNPEEEERHGTD